MTVAQEAEAAVPEGARPVGRVADCDEADRRFVRLLRLWLAGPTAQATAWSERSGALGADGRLTYRQTKTGGEVSVPLAGELPEACAALSPDPAALLAAVAAAPAGRLLFLKTAAGRPHSGAAFGGWFKERVRAAGLPERCTLHGFRKARAAALGELGWSELRIGAWTGHASPSEVARHTRKANRRKMLEGPERKLNSGNRVLAFSKSGEKTK